MVFLKNKRLIVVLGVGIVVIVCSQLWVRILNAPIESKNSKEETNLTVDHNHSTNITYTRIQPFLLSIPRTVMRTTPPQFLTDVKNPCFALAENFINVGNINLSYALKMNYEIRCLPYVYLAGVEKCGTTDMHRALIKHHLVSGFLEKDQLDEYETRKSSNKYKKPHILVKSELYQKESHFWDNIRCITNYTMDQLSRSCTPEFIIRSHLKYMNTNREDFNGERGDDDLRNMVYIESTPRMVAGQFSWNEEEIHWRERQPVEFIPDRIHHVTPNAKVIFMLRNPVSRTFSDYRFLTKDAQLATDFDRKTADAIAWWKNCTKLYKDLPKVCAYGNAPVGLPIHNTRSCGLWRSNFSFICKPYKEWGCANSIDRLRLSIYHIYLREWLRVFPRKNILFLKQENIYSDKIGTLNQIYRFLELPPLNSESIKRLNLKRPIGSPRLIEMLDKTKTMLEEFFEPMNKELSNLLQEDFYSSS